MCSGVKAKPKTKTFLQGTVPWTRNQGRPKKTWNINILEWTKMNETETLRTAKDRDQWKEIIRNINSASTSWKRVMRLFAHLCIIYLWIIVSPSIYNYLWITTIILATFLGQGASIFVRIVQFNSTRHFWSDTFYKVPKNMAIFNCAPCMYNFSIDYSLLIYVQFFYGL